MTLRAKLKSAWEQKKAEREQDKRMEQDIYERKKYAREMESSAERSTKRREKAEERAEFRASGGYGGALKRGAKQTGRGFAKMGATAGGKIKASARVELKKTRKKIRTGMRGYAKDPLGSGGGFGMGGNYDLFGGAPKPRKKGKKRKGKRRSSDPFGFENIEL